MAHVVTVSAYTLKIILKKTHLNLNAQMNYRESSCGKLVIVLKLKVYFMNFINKNRNFNCYKYITLSK